MLLNSDKKTDVFQSQRGMETHGFLRVVYILQVGIKIAQDSNELFGP